MHHLSLLDALSTGWIERSLGVSRAAVSDWRRGKFPERRQRELIEAVRELLAEHEEAAPPVWARRLLVTVEALGRKEGLTENELATAEAELVVLRNLGTSGSVRRSVSGGADGGASGAG